MTWTPAILPSRNAKRFRDLPLEDRDEIRILYSTWTEAELESMRWQAERELQTTER